MKKPVIDFKAIVDRGYTLEEEYDQLQKTGKLFKLSTQNGDESFWGVKIDNEPNLFILANDVLEFLGGPRPVAGMVGWHKDGRMDRAKTIDLFIKAGQAAINYYHATKKPAKQ